MTVARHGHRDIVDPLLCSGANVNQRTGPGTGLYDSVYYTSLGKGCARSGCWIALNMAARCGHDEVVSGLLECEAIDTDVISTETDAMMPVSSPGSLLGMLKHEWYYGWQDKTVQTGMNGAYSMIWMLRACKDANSTSSRRARPRDAAVERVLAQRRGEGEAEVPGRSHEVARGGMPIRSCWQAWEIHQRVRING